MLSIVVGVAFSPVFGKLTDRCSPQFMIPTAFFLRSVSCGMFQFITTPNGPYTYIVGILMLTGSIAESITVDSLLFRSAET